MTVWEFMKARGIEPHQPAYVCLLSACSNVGALESGRRLHAAMVKSGIKLNVTMRTALIGMYSKCGSLSDSISMFDEMRGDGSADFISFNAMLSAYGQHGRLKEALELFEAMRRGDGDSSPNEVSWTTMISA